MATTQRRVDTPLGSSVWMATERGSYTHQPCMGGSPPILRRIFDLFKVADRVTCRTTSSLVNDAQSILISTGRLTLHLNAKN